MVLQCESKQPLQYLLNLLAKHCILRQQMCTAQPTKHCILQQQMCTAQPTKHCILRQQMCTAQPTKHCILWQQMCTAQPTKHCILRQQMCAAHLAKHCTVLLLTPFKSKVEFNNKPFCTRRFKIPYCQNMNGHHLVKSICWLQWTGRFITPHSNNEI